VTSKPDFKVMVLLLVFMQLTRDLFAIAKFLLVKCDYVIHLANAMANPSACLSVVCRVCRL